MSTKSDTTDFDFATFSPVAALRDWVAKSEAQWSQNVSELMKDPRASGMMNRQIDEARMMQRMFAEFAQGTLAMANLPSRSDVEGLDERMGRLEDGLAALSAEVVRLREALGPQAAAATPSRTRRPPRTIRPELEPVRTEPVEGERASKASTSSARTANRQKARPDPTAKSSRGKR
jgi:hypothetical protein